MSKLVYVIVLLLVNLTSEAQDSLNLMGENDFTEGMEREVITTTFKKEDYPTLPKSKNLEYLLPPPGRQGPQGSCWAWATTYAMRSFIDYPKRKRYTLENGSLDSNLVYSPAYSYEIYRDKTNENACNTGNLAKNSLDLLLKDGAVTLGEMNYDAKKCIRTAEAATLQKIAKGRALVGYDVYVLQDLYSAKKKLADNQPLIISIRLDDSFQLMGRKKLAPGKVHIWQEFQDYKGSHAMVCVGYNDSLNAIKVLNSWGSDWGDGGYCWIDYNIIRQQLNYFCYPEKRKVEKLQIADKIKPQSENFGSVDTPQLNAWFKKNYYVRFNSLKFVLADLNARKDFAVIEIRNDDYAFLKNFYIEKKNTKEFYIGNNKYRFRLDDIGHKGKNPFTKAAFFTVSFLDTENGF